MNQVEHFGAFIIPSRVPIVNLEIAGHFTRKPQGTLGENDKINKYLPVFVDMLWAMCYSSVNRTVD
jgi:hypothetical protein